MIIVVFTTINPPTDAIAQWEKKAHCIVVGDCKTPENWECQSCRFIPAAEQTGNFAGTLPWNHYARKMLGYVEAVRLGADRILDSDDDTWPMGGAFPPWDGNYTTAWGEHDFFNIHRVFADDGSWPRGFPLRLVNSPSPLHTHPPQPVRIGVWQGLIHGDPDLDAVCRMTRATPIFVQGKTVALPEGAACPFNSQHTLWRRELFPLLYLPATVAFRFTDILRSLVAQPIMWAMGYRLGFISPRAVQKRNPHDLMADFSDEISMYLQVESALAACRAVVGPESDVTTNLRKSYRALAQAGIVAGAELPILEAWLAEIAK